MKWKNEKVTKAKNIRKDDFSSKLTNKDHGIFVMCLTSTRHNSVRQKSKTIKYAERRDSLQKNADPKE